MALNAGAEPGAAELAVRRARQERVSQAMGQLLLRGFRMLGQCCPRCGTILLQDKEQRLHCVGCQELDGDGGGGPAPEPPTPPSPPPPQHPAAPRPEHCEGAATGLRGAPPGPPAEEVVGAARAAVLAKLGWAARELPRTSSAEGSAQLCALVRACAEALGGLQALAPPAGPP